MATKKRKAAPKRRKSASKRKAHKGKKKSSRTSSGATSKALTYGLSGVAVGLGISYLINKQ